MSLATTADAGAEAREPLAASLLRQRHGGVVRLTLNRPAQFNALSEDLLTALLSAFDALGQDATVRCIIIAGAGKAFCTGHDLKEMVRHEEQAYFQALFTRCASVMQAIRALPVPVIAQVHGVATAAGCQLVAACDLAVAGRSARFAVSGIDVGLFCATPAVALSRNVPIKSAFDMLVTGRFIDAEQARAAGLVNAVVDDDALSDSVDAYAATIAEKSAEALRVGKQMFYAQSGMTLTAAYRLAADAMATNMMQDDARRGIEAFVTKQTKPRRAVAHPGPNGR